MTIDLRHLRCFVAVAEEMHFHRAAKKLRVAQPALSRTIRILEQDLGVALFVRSNRNVAITTAGRAFLKGCKEILAKTEQVIEDVRRVDEGKIGTLRIAYTDNAINGKAPAMFKAFQRKHPDIELRLSHAVTSNQIVGLETGTLDFGFGTGSVARPGFENHCIQREAFVCVVYEGHRLANRPGIHLTELADESIVQGDPTQWEHFHSYVTPMFRRAGFRPKIAQEGLATSDIVRLVACGIGIAVLTETISDTLPPGLCILPIEDVKERLETVVVWKTSQNNTAKAHFIAFLKAALPDCQSAVGGPKTGT